MIKRGIYALLVMGMAACAGPKTLTFYDFLRLQGDYDTTVSIRDEDKFEVYAFRIRTPGYVTLDAQYKSVREFEALEKRVRETLGEEFIDVYESLDALHEGELDGVIEVKDFIDYVETELEGKIKPETKGVRI